MADINIERKRKSPLRWIIGVLVLAALALLLMRTLGGNDEAADGDSTTATTNAPAP